MTRVGGDPGTDAGADATRRTTGRRAVLVAAVLSGFVAYLVAGPDLHTLARQAHELRQAARSDPLPALVLFAAVEVAVVALWLPVGIWMTVLAGFLFDVWLGTLVVSLASTAGAVLAFLSARYVFREAIERAARSRPRFGRRLARLDAGFRRHGAYYVLLLRLTPVVPFWLLNLGLGLTRVRLRDYWWATQLGMLPVTLVVANAGARLSEVGSVRDVLSPRVVLSLGLLPLLVLVLHSLARHMARRRLTTPNRRAESERHCEPTPRRE